jgi:hypothetical protein
MSKVIVITDTIGVDQLDAYIVLLMQAASRTTLAHELDATPEVPDEQWCDKVAELAR